MRKLFVFLRKNFALFFSTRGYNVLLLMLTQYIGALFFFSIEDNWLSEFSNLKLHLIIISSALSLSAGFLINNFYDQERDLVSKPIRTKINSQISTNSKLILYLALNFMGLCIAYLASIKILLFFSFYQFLFWFYSHKLNRILFVNNFVYAILVSFPFLALLIHYNNFSLTITIHSFFLFILILTSDIFKDFRSITADIVYNYKTIPLTYNLKSSRYILSALLLIGILNSLIYIFLFQNSNHLIYYHFLGIIVIGVCFYLLWRSENKIIFSLISLLLRFYILLGVLSIPLLKYSNILLTKFTGLLFR